MHFPYGAPEDWGLGICSSRGALGLGEDLGPWGRLDPGAHLKQPLLLIGLDY